MNKKFNFISEEESKVSKEFIRMGYIIVDVENQQLLDELRQEVVDCVSKRANIQSNNDPELFLNEFHKKIKKDMLNDIRMATFTHLNKLEWSMPSYYSLAEKFLNYLVGNELVMQKQINLSIQMPEDATSVLSLHSDVYSGQSPFEINQWLPLVNCDKTKSMFILPSQHNKELIKNFHIYENKGGGMGKMYEDCEQLVKWIKIEYGQVLLFYSGLLHGNVINKTSETRFSLNTRYKSLFSPYTMNGKGLGSFYNPITTKSMTKLGLSFTEPKGFE